MYGLYVNFSNTFLIFSFIAFTPYTKTYKLICGRTKLWQYTPKSYKAYLRQKEVVTIIPKLQQNNACCVFLLVERSLKVEPDISPFIPAKWSLQKNKDFYARWKTPPIGIRNGSKIFPFFVAIAFIFLKFLFAATKITIDGLKTAKMGSWELHSPKNQIRLLHRP